MHKNAYFGRTISKLFKINTIFCLIIFGSSLLFEQKSRLLRNFNSCPDLRSNMYATHKKHKTRKNNIQILYWNMPHNVFISALSRLNTKTTKTSSLVIAFVPSYFSSAMDSKKYIHEDQMWARLPFLQKRFIIWLG